MPGIKTYQSARLERQLHVVFERCTRLYDTLTTATTKDLFNHASYTQFKCN